MDNMNNTNKTTKVKRTEIKDYNWSKEEEKYLATLVRSMYDAGLNIAEIRNDFIIMLGIALYKLEVGME